MKTCQVDRSYNPFPHLVFCNLTSVKSCDFQGLINRIAFCSQYKHQLEAKILDFQVEKLGKYKVYYLLKRDLGVYHVLVIDDVLSKQTHALADRKFTLSFETK